MFEVIKCGIPVYIVLAVGGQVVVDDAGDLLHVDAAREQVGGDEHARGARAELAHDHLALALVHVAVHRRHREVALVHRLRQPVHLTHTHIAHFLTNFILIFTLH